MAYTYSENKIDLIINKVSRAIYKKLQENGDIGENEIYLITDPIMDAANDKIINVTDPTDPTDAANKRYVDNAISSKPAVTVKLSEDGGQTYEKLDEVFLVNIGENEYHELVKSGNVLSNAIYEVNYENENCFGARITNVGDPVDGADAATKGYVDSKISTVRVPTKTSDLVNDSGFLTAHQSLSDYYNKTQIETNYYNKTEINEISANLAGKSAVKVSIPEKNISTDLSVLNIVKLTKTKYRQLESAGQILSSNLYVIETEENDILFGGNSFTC